MYHEGEGTKISKRRAGRWFLKAAEQGRKEAQYNVAMMYHFGTLASDTKMCTNAVEHCKRADMQFIEILPLPCFKALKACDGTDRQRQQQCTGK